MGKFMDKRIFIFPLVFLIVALLVPWFNGKNINSFQGSSLNPIETQIIERVNGNAPMAITWR